VKKEQDSSVRSFKFLTKQKRNIYEGIDMDEALITVLRWKLHDEYYKDVSLNKWFPLSEIGVRLNRYRFMVICTRRLIGEIVEIDYYISGDGVDPINFTLTDRVSNILEKLNEIL
jgi:hypothetical protein